MSDEKDAAKPKDFTYKAYDVKVNGTSEVKEGKNAGRTMISGTFRAMGSDGKEHVKLFAAFDGEKMSPASKILELLPAIAEARAARDPSAAKEPELWLKGSFRNKPDIGKDGVQKTKESDGSPKSKSEFIVSFVDTKDERAAFHEARLAAAPAMSKESDGAEVGL